MSEINHAVFQNVHHFTGTVKKKEKEQKVYIRGLMYQNDIVLYSQIEFCQSGRLEEL